MTVAAIVVAAGSGERLGAGVPKAFVVVAGEPLLAHAVRPFAGCALIVVAPAQLVDSAAALIPGAAVVPGGRVRQDSVARGLAVLPDAADIVLVHDAARAFTPRSVVERVIAAIEAGADAAIPALPVSDTIKRVGPDGSVLETLDRAALVSVQTPQGFRRGALVAAHAAASANGASASGATDDAALVEAAGGRVVVVDGDPEAFKVTLPADLVRAELLLARRV